MAVDNRQPMASTHPGKCSTFANNDRVTTNGGSKISNKKGLAVHHVSSFAFNDVTTNTAPTGIASAPGQIAETAYWTWQMMLGVAILALGAISRLRSALDELSVASVIQGTFKGFIGFFCGKLWVILHGAETGIIGGFFGSLWESYPVWFEWIVRLAVYGFVVQKYHLRLKLVGWVRQRTRGSSKPTKNRTSSACLGSSDPAPDVDDGARQGDLIKMDIDVAHRALASAPCRVSGADRARIAREDFLVSRLPAGDEVV